MVTTQYPTAIPTTNQCPTNLTDFVSDVLVGQQNPPHAEIIAIATELGTLPKGDYATVKARLDFLENLIYATNIIGIGAFDITRSGASATYRGFWDRSGKYARPESINGVMVFPVILPADLRGKTVQITELTIYYFTVSASPGADYITYVRLIQNDGDGSSTLLLNHDTDIANGSNGNGNHNVIDTPLDMGDKPTYLELSVDGSDNFLDVRFYSAVLKYKIEET